MKQIFFLLLLTSVLGFSQTRSVNGLVVVDFSEDAAESVLIKNLDNDHAVLTNLSGGFIIKASVGDTLTFESAFLKPRKVVVTNSMMKQDPFVIHMNIEVIQLDDVIAKSPLTGYMKEDVSKVKLDYSVEKIYAGLGMDIRLEDIEPREKVKKPGELFPKIGGVPIPVTLDIQGLIKTINGDYRRLRNQYEYDDREKDLTAIREYYGDKFFLETLKIPETEIRNFIMFCYELGDVKQNFKYKDFVSVEFTLEKMSKEYLERLKKREN